MHVTNWATAKREDPELDAVLHWLEAKKKTDLRTLLRDHASSEEGQIVWRNSQNFTVLQDALCLLSMPKGENEGSITLHGAKGAPDCHFKWVSLKMWDIKAVTIHYPYYKNVSGGQEWPNR